MNGGGHSPQEALEIETYVESRRGQWVVSIVVIFADEVVRKEISTYHTERMATIAASLIKRAARRDSPLARPGNLPSHVDQFDLKESDDD